MPASSPDKATGWTSVEWSLGMASMAWLMDQRYLQLELFEHSLQQRQECVRLRAMVAVLLWQGGYPERLQTIERGDVKALCARHAQWIHSLGDSARGLPSLLTRGPQQAIDDWLASANAGSKGVVFRRITPNGAVAARGLSLVGIHSILSTLLTNSLAVGLVPMNFAIKFDTGEPIGRARDTDPKYVRTNQHVHVGSGAKNSIHI
jgi:hypothetical protein